jgi:hypothetical protein
MAIAFRAWLGHGFYGKQRILREIRRALCILYVMWPDAFLYAVMRLWSGGPGEYHKIMILLIQA